jgi:hypothetical protein
MPDQDIQKSINRDDDQKPGAPPRSANEPDGAEGSVQTDKTATDPSSGAAKGPPAPNQSSADQVRPD